MCFWPCCGSAIYTATEPVGNLASGVHVLFKRSGSNGDLKWRRPGVNPSVATSGAFYSLAADRNSNVFLSGRVFTGETDQLWKYDKSGNLLWSKSLGNQIRGNGQPVLGLGVSVDTEGNCYVGSGMNEDGYNLHSYSPDGTLRWRSNVGGVPDEITSTTEFVINWTAAHPQSGVIYAVGNFRLFDGTTINAIDTSDGSTIWGISTGATEDPDAVACDTQGNVWAGGGTWFRKYSSVDGSELVEVYDNTASGVGTSCIACDEEDNVYAGFTVTGFLGSQLARKFDSDGNLVWSKQISTTNSPLRSVAVKRDGRSYWGHNGNSTLPRLLTALEPDGSTKWTLNSQGEAVWSVDTPGGRVNTRAS